MLKTNCHIGCKLHLQWAYFRQLGREPSNFFPCGWFYVRPGEQKKTWNFGGPSSAKLQAIPIKRTTGSHQKKTPQKQQPFIHLPKSSVSTVLNILVFLPRGFLTFPGKKTQKPWHIHHPLELSKGAPLKSPLCWISSTWGFPPWSEELRKSRSKFTKGPNRKPDRLPTIHFHPFCRGFCY